jgi:hypothetical protein
MGECNLEKHHIETGDASPIACNPHRLAHYLRVILKKEIDDLIACGVIEPSISPWAAPCLYVPKKDGTWRLCVDFRKLNEVIRPMVYPLPRIEDIFDTLEGSAFFTAIDLAKGFWQIALDDESKEKAAFTTIYGQYQYRRLPFGLATSPGAFQKVMNTVLAGLNWVQCMVYLDDILIFSPDFETHCETLKTVFERLLSANLKVKLSKCEWARTELNYLGHVINTQGKSPDPKKTEALKLLKPPSCVKDIESFLGKVGYYHKFVKDFSKWAYPLNRLKRKDTPWSWGPVEQEAFEELRSQLCEAPVLRHPDFNRPFVLQTDASGYGLGAVLSQEFDDGEHPISYASRTLEDRETRHAIIEKEALAIAWGIHHFRHYLLGRQFTVQTDHKPLLALKRIRDQNARLQKLSLKLQGYRFTIEFRAGVKNQNADLLSRYPQIPLNPKPGDQFSVAKNAQKKYAMKQVEKSVFALQFSEEEISPEQAAEKWGDIAAMQKVDPDLKGFIDFLIDGTLPELDDRLSRFILLVHDHFCIEDGLLYRVNNSKIQLCIPDKLRNAVLFQCHDVPCSGHLGMKKAYQKMARRYYWMSMHRDMEAYISACPGCIANKPPPKHPKEPIGYKAIPDAPWEVLHMDVWTPGRNCQTPAGNSCVIAFKCAYSKYVVAYTLPNHTAETVTEVIANRLIPQYGAPLVIVCDNAPEFAGKVMAALFDVLGITRHLVTPRDPKSNGQIERFFRTFRASLATLASINPVSWDKYVPSAVFAYNASLHRAIQNTPFFLMYGRDPEFLMHTGVPDPRSGKAPAVAEWFEILSTARQVVKKHLEQAALVNQENYNRNCRPQTFHVGDAVMLLRPAPVGECPPKLAPKYVGPYRIVLIKGKVARLRSLVDPSQRLLKDTSADFDHMRPCDLTRFIAPQVDVHYRVSDPNLEDELSENDE